MSIFLLILSIISISMLSCQRCHGYIFNLNSRICSRKSYIKSIDENQTNGQVKGDDLVESMRLARESQKLRRSPGAELETG